MKNFISNIIAGIIAAVIVAALQANSAFILESINTALNPIIVATSLAFVALGICLGWLLRGLFTWRPKRKVNFDEVNDHNRKMIMRLDEGNKRLLKALLLKDEIYCNADDWESYCWSFGSDFLQQFIEYETVEGSRIKLRANEVLRQFYENNSDIFDAIDNRSIEERVVFDPDKRMSSGSYYSQGLSWWWYTDDKKVKDEQDKRLEEAMKNSGWI